MIDFRQDTNGDIDLQKGDIHYVESTVAHQRDLLLTGMGELKHAPLSGVGIHDFLNNENPAAMLRMVRKKYIQDGMTVNSVVQNAAKQLEVDAYYDVYPVVPHFAKPVSSGFPFTFDLILSKGENEFSYTFPVLLGEGNQEFYYRFDFKLT